MSGDTSTNTDGADVNDGISRRGERQGRCDHAIADLRASNPRCSAAVPLDNATASDTPRHLREFALEGVELRSNRWISSIEGLEQQTALDGADVGGRQQDAAQ